MGQTLSLFRLQQVDNQIDRLQARLKDIIKLLEDDAEIRQLNDNVAAVDARCRSAEQRLNQAEKDVQSQLIKIEQDQSSLYGGKSHSPKELQDLQNEIAALKRYLIVLEDRQIDAMQESETADSERHSIHIELNLARNVRAEKEEGFRLEQAAIQNDIDRFLVERNAIAGAIPSTDLSLYNQLRQQRRGVAVALIGDNSCGACGSTLSLAQIQSVHSSGQIMLCPSCGRILYAN